MKKVPPATESDSLSLDELLRRVVKQHPTPLEPVGERRRMLRETMLRLEKTSAVSHLADSFLEVLGKFFFHPQFAFALLLVFSLSFLHNDSRLLPPIVQPQLSASTDELESLYEWEEDSVGEWVSEEDKESPAISELVTKEQSEEDSAFGFEGDLIDSELEESL